MYILYVILCMYRNGGERKLENDIILVKQLPIITQKLQIISDEIDKKVEYALSLEANEDTIKVVKQERANLNKIKDELESKRKEVKNAILNPYNEFEEVYNSLVKNKLAIADTTLRQEIDDIETQKEKEKEGILREFFLEHLEANHLVGMLNFEDIGLNITLSASEKSLKTQVKDFVEKVANDIKAMQSDEDKEEIFLEYKNNGFDYAKAKNTIVEKKKVLEEFKQHIAKNGEEIKQDEVIVQNVETLISQPKEIVEEEKYEFDFRVRMTKTQAKELKLWLQENEIEIIS